MPNRGRLLLAGAISVLMLACQAAGDRSPSAAAAPATAPPAASAATQAASQQPGGPAPAAVPATPPAPAGAPPAVGASKPSAQAPAARQARAAVPRIGLEALPFGFAQPLFLTHAGDGSGRLFVVEKGGLIRVVKGDQLLSTPFIDLRGRVRASGSEQGLLGLAFHPRYRENGRFFVGYTDNDGRNTVERFQVSADPDRGDPASGVVLLSIEDPAQNHNGGMVAFGPDGYLWVGTGDGGGSGDRYRNGQNPQTLLGKMLRLDVDGGEPYAIPADNPHVGQGAFRPEIWAIGLRNPWRYSFDRATGDLWIADVGQNAYEEIHLTRAGSPGGLNYGWPIMEGLHCFPASANCDPTPYERPVAEYGRDGGCSVTGGYVYRGAAQPALNGLYFFGDFCSGRIWSLDSADGASWRMTEQLKDALQISSFGEDEAGEVYVTTFSGPNATSHRVLRIVGQ